MTILERFNDFIEQYLKHGDNMFEKIKKDDTEEVRFTDLDAAILLAVNDFRNKERDFSAHDVTKWIRNECNEGRLKIDSCYNINFEDQISKEVEDVYEYNIEHHDVRVMVSDFYENGVLKQFGYYNRDFSGGFINYIFSAEVEEQQQEDTFTGQIKTDNQLQIEKEDRRERNVRLGKLMDFLNGLDDGDEFDDSDDNVCCKNNAISTVYGGPPSISVGVNEDSGFLKDIDKTPIQRKITKYVDNFLAKWGIGPTLKQVQSRMKGYKISCNDIFDFFDSNMSNYTIRLSASGDLSRHRVFPISYLTSTNVDETSAAGDGGSSVVEVKDIDKIDVQMKIKKYVDNYISKFRAGPSLKQIQSRMKGYKISCKDIYRFFSETLNVNYSLISSSLGLGNVLVVQR